jgi:thiol:disulfide interchange protein DsbD
MQRVILKIWIGLISLIAVGFTASNALAASSPSVDTGKVVAQLISSHDRIDPGQEFHVALKTTLDDHWHTYWRNPGDSGERVYIEWGMPESVTAGDIVWPIPAPIATGPIINYGFEGTPHFPVPFRLSDDAAIGDIIEITARAYYLVCYDVCIPENVDLTLTMTVGGSHVDVLSKAGIDNALLDAPKRGEAEGGIELDGTDISITLNKLPSGASLSEAYFFPYEQGFILHSEPQHLSQGTDGLKITTVADYRWDDETPQKLEGVIRYKRGERFEGEVVTLNVGSAVPIGAITAAAGGANTSAISGPASGPASGLNLWTAIIGALIGGLILNIMPCVFPIISIKALNIANCAHCDVQAVRREAWGYMGGVLATFLTLTLVLLALKAAGSQIGWGFQLQSPIITGGLALLLFAIGLNLLGVFDVGGRMQNLGGELPQSGGLRGAFFTGALAVIVATPCTAPFMAGAVGYALSQSAVITLVVFMALAIGFALPFLLIAYVPGILNRLPKPGPWMIRFKEILSFPMFAAVIWLVWVVSQQAGGAGLILTLSAMLLFGFGLWLWKTEAKIVKAAAIAALLAAIALPLMLRPSGDARAVIDAHETPWSAAAIDAAMESGKTVFVDFTAAWCVTCKLNEHGALAHAEVKARLSDDDVIFMVADWTNKNDEIAAELSRHGRSGVPLYLVYNPANDSPMTPQILPQILTKDIILSALASGHED